MREQRSIVLDITGSEQDNDKTYRGSGEERHQRNTGEHKDKRHKCHTLIFFRIFLVYFMIIHFHT